MGLRLPMEDHIINIAIPLDIFVFFLHIYFFFFGLKKISWVISSLRTSLLCIMGELAGGGFVAVAVGVSCR